MEWERVTWMDDVWESTDENGNEWSIYKSDIPDNKEPFAIKVYPLVDDGKNYHDMKTFKTYDAAVLWINENYNDYQKYSITIENNDKLGDSI